MTSDTTTGWNFNRYNYAANNPYAVIDPDGRSSVCATQANCQVIQVNSLGPVGDLEGGTPASSESTEERQIDDAIDHYRPDTYGAQVTFDPNLDAEGSNPSTDSILVGKRAFESLGNLAATIEHEGVHVSQSLRGNTSVSRGPALWEAEARAYRHILNSAKRFDLTPAQVQRNLEMYRRYYNALPPGTREKIDQDYGGVYE